MKKNLILTSMLLLGVALTGHAQIARWLIHPDYDQVNVDFDAKVVICDSAGHKVLWDLKGNRYGETADHVNHFRNGYAVTTNKENQTTGFYTESGQFTRLKNCYIAFSHPYFASDYLIVADQSGYFHYTDNQGHVDEQQYDIAFPYRNDYASCHTYEDLFRLKRPYWQMLNKDNTSVQFNAGGKPVDNDDIDFLSSVNDEGIAIVVVKNKLYYFKDGNTNLQPVYAKDGETNPKNQAKLDSNIETNLQLRNDSIYILTAKSGKTDQISFRFDRFRVPLSINVNNVRTDYKLREAEEKDYPSPLRKTEKNKKYGVNWEQEEILPPQFEDFGKTFNNNVVVKLDGKYGIIAVEKDVQFKLRMNEGDDIGFKHKRFKTTLRLDIPTYIPADKTRIEIHEETGCSIDKTSIETKNTEYGNYVQYNCVLSIPKDLTLELTETVYPALILYEGLVSRIIPFKVNTWYNVYFDLKENEEPYIQNGILISDFEIDDPKGEGADTRWVPTIVCEERDSIPYQTDISPINNFKFKYELSPLRDGLNTYYIQITEDGCPTVSFPREVSYAKPTAKQPAKKTKATIRTKQKVVNKPKPQPKPTLDIDI